MPDNQEPTATQELVGDMAPGLGAFTDDVLFGDVWRRDGLSPRDRSLITIATSIADGSTDPLSAHLGTGQSNGLTQDEIGEVITHRAFDAGWPRAMSAVTVARTHVGV